MRQRSSETFSQRENRLKRAEDFNPSGPKSKSWADVADENTVF